MHRVGGIPPIFFFIRLISVDQRFYPPKTMETASGKLGGLSVLYSIEGD